MKLRERIVKLEEKMPKPPSEEPAHVVDCDALRKKWEERVKERERVCQLPLEEQLEIARQELADTPRDCAKSPHLLEVAIKIARLRVAGLEAEAGKIARGTIDPKKTDALIPANGDRAEHGPVSS